ncbi:MAG: hypothetical protein U0354_12305 [Candidatus Sericytochromatia bacterium]
MSGVDAIEGAKSKGNKAIANHAFNQHIAAQDRAMMYEVEKKKLMASGVPEDKAIKMAEDHIKKFVGASANAGSKTNNDKEALVDKSKQQDERLVETNMKNEVKTLIDGASDTDNSQDNMAGNQGRKAIAPEDKKEVNSYSSLDLKEINTFDKKNILRMLTKAGVTPTEHLTKGIASLSDNEASDLVVKLRNKGANEMMKEINKINM